MVCDGGADLRDGSSQCDLQRMVEQAELGMTAGATTVGPCTTDCASTPIALGGQCIQMRARAADRPSLSDNRWGCGGGGGWLCSSSNRAPSASESCGEPGCPRTGHLVKPSMRRSKSSKKNF